MDSVTSKQISEYADSVVHVRDEFLSLIGRLEFDTDRKLINNAANKKILIKGTHELRKNLNEGYMKEVVKNCGDNLLSLIPYTINELKPDIRVTSEEEAFITLKVYDLIEYDGISEQLGSPLKKLYLDRSDFQNLIFSHQYSLKFGRPEEEIKDIVSRYITGVMKISLNKIVPELFVMTYRYINELIGKSNDKYDWIYEGVLLERSRQFCKDRQGKTFTTKEVKSWKDEEWKEKPPFKYNPWRDCGGFECGHILKPVLKKEERGWKNTGKGIFLFKL